MAVYEIIWEYSVISERYDANQIRLNENFKPFLGGDEPNI